MSENDLMYPPFFPFLTKLGQKQIIQLSSNDPIYLINEIPCNYVIRRVDNDIFNQVSVMNRNVIFVE